MNYTKLLNLEGKITEVHAKEINEIITSIVSQATDKPTLKKFESDFAKAIDHETGWFNDCVAHSEGQVCCLDKEHVRGQKIRQYAKVSFQK